MITDPWTVSESNRPAVVSVSAQQSDEFEDNFAPVSQVFASGTAAAASASALPDSKEYLASLGKNIHTKIFETFACFWLECRVSTTPISIIPTVRSLPPFNLHITNRSRSPRRFQPNTERKLSKLRTDTGVLQQLTARRENCVERLLQGDIDLPTAAEFGFDPIDESCDQQTGVVGDLVRHLRPEQAISAAELLHLIQFDQLQPQPAVESTPNDPDNGSADSVSR